MSPDEFTSNQQAEPITQLFVPNESSLVMNKSEEERNREQGNPNAA